MPPPFSVRSGVSLERNLGQWDDSGNITIPGNITAANVPSGASFLTGLTAADSTITVAGTATAPTVKLGTVPESAVTNLVSDLALKAPLASPTFTGTATAPTLAGSTDVTSNGFSVPRGLVRRVSRANDSTGSTATTQAAAQGVLSLQVTNLVVGRLYMVGCPSIAASSQVANSIVYFITFTTDNTTPTSSSSILMLGESELPTISRTETFGAFYCRPFVAATVNLFVRLCFYSRSGGGLTATRGDATYPLELHIIDMGTDPGTSGGTII
jgi:hypothetical protein